MRLIDADKLLENFGIEPNDLYAKKFIYEAPTIDGVKVVRCKSCKLAKWSKKNNAYYCGRMWQLHRVKERDFCSYGIRKD